MRFRDDAAGHHTTLFSTGHFVAAWASFATGSRVLLACCVTQPKKSGWSSSCLTFLSVGEFRDLGSIRRFLLLSSCSDGLTLAPLRNMVRRLVLPLSALSALDPSLGFQHAAVSVSFLGSTVQRRGTVFLLVAPITFPEPPDPEGRGRRVKGAHPVFVVRPRSPAPWFPGSGLVACAGHLARASPSSSPPSGCVVCGC